MRTPMSLGQMWPVLVVLWAMAGCETPPQAPDAPAPRLDGAPAADGAPADGGPTDVAIMDAAVSDIGPDAAPRDAAPITTDEGVDDAETPADLGPTRPDGPISGSYINEVWFETSEEGGADIDGDGDPDNRLGVLLESIRLVAPDLDANVKLRTAISEGTLRVGARWNGLDADQLLDGDNFEVGVIDFEAPPGYTPEARSIHPDGTPRGLLTEAYIEGGILHARAREMRLVFTVWEIPVVLDVAHVSLTGMVLPFIDGVGIRDGRITGGVTIESIGGFLNDFMAEPECDCLALDGPFIDLSRGVADACHPDLDHTRCGPDDQPSCVVLAERCPIIVPMFTNGADVDSDGDGEADALGVDLRLNALGVTLEE